ncbi:MAG: 16S rRNA (cytosine(967)-C(5))-methyltransferase RsmB [Geobacteraceae bacterium]|nr:16S rRNA (cytosine(967)-C(5))-methyltransferase RsmB [Geobacteraceae bacterium]
MNKKNPRQVAFEILLRIEKENSYADILLDRELSSGMIQGPDRGLLTELVFGVLRRRGTLDHLIDSFSDRKTAKLERAVVMLLRLGLYQALFLDRVPVSAAVNETVKLAKVFAPRASGFVNAVLRRADRERDTIPWPDQAADPATFLAVRYSQPRWLVEQWLEQLGPAEAESLAAAMVEPPPLTIRVNSLKISREDFLARLAAEGVVARSTDYSPVGVHILSSVYPASLAGFQEGFFTVQDESSQLASLFLDPQPGNRVLDLCAAPGGKATHLAQLMENRGSLLAGDLDGRKLRRIEETAARLSVSIVETMRLDASRPLSALAGKKFDRILVDAPCTGLGVIRRNPEAKWRLTPADVSRLAQLQGSILRNAADHLEIGGVLVYSTCSTSREENEGVIDVFLSERQDFVVEDLRQVFPHFAALCTDRGMFRGWPHRYGMDGFCAVRLKKIC